MKKDGVPLWPQTSEAYIDKRQKKQSKKIIFFSEKLVEIKKALIFAPRKRAENDKEKVQKIKGLKKFNFFSKRLVNKK